MKRVLCVLLVAAVLGGGLTAAAEPYQSYIYNAYGDPVYAPDLYTVRDTWSGGSLGIGELNEPGGLVCGADGYLYLTDTKNDRIIRLSPDLTEKTVYTAFTREGENDIRVAARISAQEPTLNPELLAEALRQLAESIAPDFARFTRLETYDAEMNIYR